MKPIALMVSTVAGYALSLLSVHQVQAASEITDASIKAAVERSISNYIRPSFEEFFAAASVTEGALAKLCQAPSSDDLDSAQASFNGLAVAWSRIEILRFGPLAEDNRFERLHFWPDRRGRALRQVQAALASLDPSVTSTASISGKSVAVQGLGALEYLLFGTGFEDLTASDKAGNHRCQFAEAVAGNISSIADNMQINWTSETGYSQTMTSFGPDNDRYRDQREVAVQMFATVVDGLSWVRDAKLRPVLGETPEKAKPKRGAFWRSGQTFNSINANLEGIESYLEASGLLALLPVDEARFADSIRFEFSNAKRTLESIETAPLIAFTNDEDRGKLSYLLIVTDSLSKLMEGFVGPTLGIEAGFSVLDGD